MAGHEKDIEALLDLGNRGTQSREERIALTLGAARTVIDCDAVMLVAPARNSFERTGIGPGNPTPVPMPPATETAVRYIGQSQGALRIADLSQDARLKPEACPGLESGPAMFVPLRGREHGGGYLGLFRRRGARLFQEIDARHAMLIGAWSMVALDNLRLAERLEKLAITDDLTQVYNYRFLKGALRREIRRAARFSQELSLVMVDVDNLKAYNDQHGHLRGSFLLKRVAGILAQNVRSFDLIAKYGGDEFTLILPQTGRQGAVVVAERMRVAVERCEFPLAPAGTITVSMGVATYPHDAGDGMGLVRAADNALYRAKRTGRNRTEAQSGEAA